MSEKKRAYEDVYDENKAARLWVEEPYVEEDYAWEIETESVAERVFQMLFGGNLFLDDVPTDGFDLWMLYRSAPTKQMRDYLAPKLGPMVKVRTYLVITSKRPGSPIYGYYDSKKYTIMVPVLLMKTARQRNDLTKLLAKMRAATLYLEAKRDMISGEVVKSYSFFADVYFGSYKWWGGQLTTQGDGNLTDADAKIYSYELPPEFEY